MESTEIVDRMIDGATPAEIQDAIKDTLYSKSAAKIDAMKPEVAAGLFGNNPEVEPEVEPEIEQEPTTETEE